MWEGLTFWDFVYAGIFGAIIYLLALVFTAFI
jgi:hypothetical protein